MKNPICAVKADWHKLNIRVTLIGGAVGILCGLLSTAVAAMAGGSGSLYCYLVLPFGAPSRFWLILLRGVAYFLLGCAEGAVFACPMPFCSKERENAQLLWCVTVGLHLLFCPLFYACRAFFLSWLTVTVMLISALAVTVLFWRVFRPAALFIALHTVFLFYLWYLTFFIFLYNG